MKTLRRQIVAAGAESLSSAAAQVLRTEAEVLLRLGKGIRLLEPDVPSGTIESAAPAFVQDVQATVRAIEDDATASARPVLEITPEDAAPDGDSVYPEP